MSEILGTIVHCNLWDCLNNKNGKCNKDTIIFDYGNIEDMEICQSFEFEGDYEN